MTPDIAGEDDVARILNMNQDGITNILDVVALVQTILGTRTI